MSQESRVVLTDVAAGPDLEEVRRLFLEYARSLPFSLDFQDFDRELAGLPGGYAPPGGRLLLARVGGEAAGCVALHAWDGAAGEIKRLYVRPAFRGRGVGRALAAAIVDAGRECGYARLLLDTVDTMTEAIALYSSLGFAPAAPYRPNPIPGAAFFELPLRGSR
ncbi:MAG: GNAT family N-acetyltransferase [Acidobacteria bacterium]|jgi:carbonic anhydrase|nr:GNAT family N-acetyltransferase [Acidobacteriota bacterium]